VVRIDHTVADREIDVLGLGDFEVLQKLLFGRVRNRNFLLIVWPVAGLVCLP
jgi:hypothetical protein